LGAPDLERFGLRTGDLVDLSLTMGDASQHAGIARVHQLNGQAYSAAKTRPAYNEMRPAHPSRQIRLETPGGPFSTRIIDLFAPIGFGQRCLLVSPPKAGKTTILKEIGHGILANHSAARLIVLLVGERPEEISELDDALTGATIFASSFDGPDDRHIEIANLAVEHAKRLAEQHLDAVVLFDSVTRLVSAYNLSSGRAGGKTLSGGVDAAALSLARQVFGVARCCKEGGSVTMIATCLVAPNNRMNDVVFEELKGTGNMELYLNRNLAQQRIFPAIDLLQSGTRKEELLLGADQRAAAKLIRTAIEGQQYPEQKAEQYTRFLGRLGATENNAQLLKSFVRLLHKAAQ
jgi:transcription termination factor Rho